MPERKGIVKHVYIDVSKSGKIYHKSDWKTKMGNPSQTRKIKNGPHPAAHALIWGTAPTPLRCR